MLKDLLFVLEHIKHTIETNNLVDLYAKFSTTLQQITTASTPELQTQFKEEKSQIENIHITLEPDTWSYYQRQMFKKFGAQNTVGKQGWENFKKALEDNAANTPGAIEELKKQQDAIAKLLQTTNYALESLDNFKQKNINDPDKIVIQIVFDQEVAVNNLVDLAKRATEWEKIIRAYSLLAKESPENTEIIATTKGSPYLLWLATSKFIAKAICDTIEPFIDLRKSVLDNKILATQLEKSEIEIKSKEYDLYKKIDEHERKRILEIAESISILNDNKELTSDEKNEAIAALKKAGPSLYDFISNGGRIDISDSDDNDQNNQNFKLEPGYKVIEKLDQKVQKLLSTGEGTKNLKKKSVDESTQTDKPKNETEAK